ncbi:MAG: ABC transporter permease [Bacillota bacterium]|nr:ABC transporter permease [Bacillota bacterium]
MRVYIKEILQRPLNTLFISVGTIIAVYCLSIGISFFDINFQMKNDPSVYKKSNFNAKFDFSSKKSFNTILSNLDSKDKNNSFLSPLYFIDTKEKDKVNMLSGVYNYNNLNSIFPLYSGRYFSKSEMLSDNNVAMIGYGILNQTYNEEGNKYIDIYGMKYRVIGIIGRYSSSYWNIQILVPFKALPKDLLSQESSSIQLTFPNNMLNNNEYFARLKEKLKKEGLLSIDIQQQSGGDPIKKTFEDDKSRYLSFIFTVVLALVSLITFSTFWGVDLKRNFAIKRILGASNFNIIKMLSFEISFITITSTIIAFGLHIATLSILNEMFSEKVYFNAVNVLWAGIFALIATCLNILWVYRNILKFNIIEDIK